MVWIEDLASLSFDRERDDIWACKFAKSSAFFQVNEEWGFVEQRTLQRCNALN